jgi:hypothetical protein
MNSSHASDAQGGWNGLDAQLRHSHGGTSRADAVTDPGGEPVLEQPVNGMLGVELAARVPSEVIEVHQSRMGVEQEPEHYSLSIVVRHRTDVRIEVKR